MVLNFLPRYYQQLNPILGVNKTIVCWQGELYFSGQVMGNKSNSLPITGF
jgi:hypothetical protein